MSAVITTTGRSEVRRAVTSVTTQTLQAEIVVVLDNPAKRDYVQNLLQGLDYRLLITEKAGGAAARNAGAEASSGEYVAFLDDDDWWAPEKLERQVKLLDAQNQPTIANTKSIFITARGRNRTVPQVLYSNDLDISSYLTQRTRLRYGRHFMQTSSLMMRRDVVLRLPWDPAMRKHQDWQFLASARQHGVPILTIPEPLVFVQQGTTDSISRLGNWRRSLDWYPVARRAHDHRAIADFVLVQLLRPALKAGDPSGISFALRELRAIPHAAAVILAFLAAVELLAKTLILTRSRVADSREQ